MVGLFVDLMRVPLKFEKEELEGFHVKFEKEELEGLYLLLTSVMHCAESRSGFRSLKQSRRVQNRKLEAES